MEGRISMSRKELSRLKVLTKVRERRLTILQASNILGLSTRQVKRLFNALKLNGPRGLVSKRVGSKGNHHLDPQVKEESLKQIRAKYHDFGPTLAHQYLVEEHGLKLSVGSVRTLMIQDGPWASKSVRRQRVFQLRTRRSREGELIQLDGSDHDWFEGRGPKCTLLVSGVWTKHRRTGTLTDS